MARTNAERQQEATAHRTSAALRGTDAARYRVLTLLRRVTSRPREPSEVGAVRPPAIRHTRRRAPPVRIPVRIGRSSTGDRTEPVHRDRYRLVPPEPR